MPSYSEVLAKDTRIAELEQTVAALREALEVARPYLPVEERDRRHSPDCTCHTCDKDRMLEQIDTALTNPATAEALERVRRVAKIEALEEAATNALALQHAIQPLIEGKNNNAGFARWLRREAELLKAAALRGGE